MHASFFASLPPQINLLISEASVHLNSFKIPSLTGKPSSFKFSNRVGLNRVQETLHDLPECIRLSRHVHSSATSGLAQATTMLKANPLLKHVDAKQILLPTRGSFNMPLLAAKPTRLLPDPQYNASSFSPIYNLWKAAFRLPNVQPRRNYSPFRFINQRRLAKLESEANGAPENAKKQAIYYKELISADFPDILIRRFESNKFAYDQECLTLYSKALARTDQLDKIVPNLLQKIKKNGEVSSLANGEGVPKATVESIVQSVVGGPGKTVRIENPGSLSSGVGIKDNPIHVVVDEARGFMFWRALRWVGVTFTYAFCILTFLSLALENSGLLKAANNQTEYEPSTQSVVKFSDVQGVEEAKQELQEIVEFLKNPSKFSELGGRLPKGVLLTGPPGTGKTLLARAVAGEADVPFFFMSGSEFDEMYVGVGARRIRELFAAARRKSPSIVFIDEIDAIGSKRNPKDQTYMKQTLNQLLVDLDGFSQTEGVIFIAATNFPELLDKALVRPGRFDRNVNVPLPDVRGRIAILEHHMHNVQVDKDVDISIVARGTPGFSGADLANLVNQAAIQASREGGKVVNLKHFEFAKDKIIMGAERRSAVITEESKLLTAYHEGGHALVAYYTPGAMPLHKATIMPRGQSLGMTVQLPEMDKDSYSRKEYQAMLDVCMGGRVAEELIFGSENVTSGAHNDIMKATDVAKRMITQFGMSEKVGPISISDDEMGQLSTQTKMVVEGEIRTFVEMAQTRANNILKTHKEELHRLAKALIEYETLDQAEIEAAINGNPIVR